MSLQQVCRFSYDRLVALLTSSIDKIGGEDDQAARLDAQVLSNELIPPNSAGASMATSFGATGMGVFPQPYEPQPGYAPYQPGRSQPSWPAGYFPFLPPPGPTGYFPFFQPYASYGAPFLPPQNSMQARKAFPSGSDVVDGVLNLSSGRVNPSYAKHLRESNALVNVDKLLEFLQLKQLDSGEVVTLDLSTNELPDEDLEFIAPIVQHLQCNVINLSFNRFGAAAERADLTNNPRKTVVEQIRRFVMLPSVRFVNLVGNYLTASDWLDWFQDLPAEAWDKIVFIPLVWVRDHVWDGSDIAGEHWRRSKDCHDFFYYSGTANPVFTTRDREILVFMKLPSAS
ncbi:hypothetical protein CAOG_01877 [Capsaspora owczarzaki ATCC 30864]|uniref:Uncharacterized protein n=1 Tax=Capsaspora owczarzaki (strain ATCC 30864) TaxID=595528 RepID=A0A0D2U632_CAPO3|nr:hypothetical protein CAOG_01877 [Capsaspora owczarzaki ATCC 30864]KJE90581.1 hypothetical protein CAOG_001877 [Capsaspora owczarzaki ATCC 30864]|eukprot:XP_004364745.1 hypothetical protein CAOG_01877 [Capsaspora owczarzaki ATCC 30864]